MVKEYESMTKTLTTIELLKALKVNRPTLYKLLASGQIPAVKVGRAWRVSEENLGEFISGSHGLGKAKN